LLDLHDWPEALEHYQLSRKPNADAIAELAGRNFVEMRDKVADQAFIKRKKLFTALHDRYPREFIPVYTMVTFTHLDYSDALRQADLQDDFYRRLVNEGLATHNPDDALLDRLIAIWRTNFS
jgi:kynurenine 3-monooxygenase